jgi:hypothetical protein
MRKKLQLMSYLMIGYDDIRLFYNGAISIASKNGLDDQNLLLATVHTFFTVNVCALRAIDARTFEKPP